METIYLKIKISKQSSECEKIREEGLFFENIASAIGLDRINIKEIDADNYKNIVKELKKRFE